MTRGASAAAREALERIAKAPRRAPEVRDLEAIRSAKAALSRMVDRYRRIAWCPGCHRPEVPVVTLMTHVFECPMHPAAVRYRLAADELHALSPQSEPPSRRPRPRVPALQLFRGEATRQPDAIRYVLDSSFTDAVALFGADASQPQMKLEWTAAVAIVGTALDELDLYAAAAHCRCPACLSPLTLDAAAEHVMACEAHPMHRVAADLEQRLLRLRGSERTTSGWVSYHRHRFELEAQQLLRASTEFLGGFSDDVGKAYVSQDAERKWNAAREHAAQVLRGDA